MDITNDTGLWPCTLCVFYLLSGNSKGSVNFIGTAPSTKEKIRTAAGHKNFKDLLVDAREEDINFQPRNHRQLQYLKGSERKFGPDPIIALHELAYMLPNFVWSIRTFPDLVVCFGMPSMLELLADCSRLLLSYDTTFNLGDFYLSVLVAKLSTMIESPCLPVAFVLHERKFQSVHMEFCLSLRSRLKRLPQTFLVTDGEAGIVNSFKTVYF